VRILQTFWAILSSYFLGVYPFGLAKFETSRHRSSLNLLIAGALGIGSRSLSLLLSAPSETALSLLAGPLQTTLLSVAAAANNVPGLRLIATLSHVHAHGPVLDLNVARFAAASIVSNGWLSRITHRVQWRTRRIVPCCLRMRIIIGVMLIRA
jgi:hypothetical protein